MGEECHPLYYYFRGLLFVVRGSAWVPCVCSSPTV